MADNNLLESYNPLYDVHLRQYFASPHMQKHLRSLGLLDSNGIPVTPNSTANNIEGQLYARHHAMMDMMLRNRERVLMQLADIQKKLDAAEKVEIYRRIRSGITNADEFRRLKLATRSFSRPARDRERRPPNGSAAAAAEAPDASQRHRRHSNSFDESELMKRIEKDFDDAQKEYQQQGSGLYKRLAANAHRYQYLHKLDDRTLINYKETLRRQLQKLERFREITFGPNSVAKHQPALQNSWFFRRRSLPSLNNSGEPPRSQPTTTTNPNKRSKSKAKRSSKSVNRQRMGKSMSPQRSAAPKKQQSAEPKKRAAPKKLPPLPREKSKPKESQKLPPTAVIRPVKKPEKKSESPSTVEKLPAIATGAALGVAGALAATSLISPSSAHSAEPHPEVSDTDFSRPETEASGQFPHSATSATGESAATSPQPQSDVEPDHVGAFASEPEYAHSPETPMAPMGGSDQDDALERERRARSVEYVEESVEPRHAIGDTPEPVAAIASPETAMAPPSPIVAPIAESPVAKTFSEPDVESPIGTPDDPEPFAERVDVAPIAQTPEPVAESPIAEPVAEHTEIAMSPIAAPIAAEPEPEIVAAIEPEPEVAAPVESQPVNEIAIAAESPATPHSEVAEPLSPDTGRSRVSFADELAAVESQQPEAEDRHSEQDAQSEATYEASTARSEQPLREEVEISPPESAQRAAADFVAEPEPVAESEPVAEAEAIAERAIAAESPIPPPEVARELAAEPPADRVDSEMSIDSIDADSYAPPPTHVAPLEDLTPEATERSIAAADEQIADSPNEGDAATANRDHRDSIGSSIGESESAPNLKVASESPRTTTESFVAAERAAGFQPGFLESSQDSVPIMEGESLRDTDSERDTQPVVINDDQLGSGRSASTALSTEEAADGDRVAATTDSMANRIAASIDSFGDRLNDSVESFGNRVAESVDSFGDRVAANVDSIGQRIATAATDVVDHFTPDITKEGTCESLAIHDAQHQDADDEAAYASREPTATTVREAAPMESPRDFDENAATPDSFVEESGVPYRDGIATSDEEEPTFERHSEVAEPIAQNVEEPVAEPVVETAAEAIAEPVAETAPEPDAEPQFPASEPEEPTAVEEIPHPEPTEPEPEEPHQQSEAVEEPIAAPISVAPLGAEAADDRDNASTESIADPDEPFGEEAEQLIGEPEEEEEEPAEPIAPIAHPAIAAAVAADSLLTAQPSIEITPASEYSGSRDQLDNSPNVAAAAAEATELPKSPESFGADSGHPTEADGADSSTDYAASEGNRTVGSATGDSPREDAAAEESPREVAESHPDGVGEPEEPKDAEDLIAEQPAVTADAESHHEEEPVVAETPEDVAEPVADHFGDNGHRDDLFGDRDHSGDPFGHSDAHSDHDIHSDSHDHHGNHTDGPAADAESHPEPNHNDDIEIVPPPVHHRPLGDSTTPFDAAEPNANLADLSPSLTGFLTTASVATHDHDNNDLQPLEFTRDPNANGAIGNGHSNGYANGNANGFHHDAHDFIQKSVDRADSASDSGSVVIHSSPETQHRHIGSAAADEIGGADL